MGYIEWLNDKYGYSFVTGLEKIPAKEYLQIIPVFAEMYEQYFKEPENVCVSSWNVSESDESEVGF